MELRQIKYFLEIVSAGSFSKAASRLRLTQPALSSQMSLLEKEFKTELLIRNSRNLTLSAAGEVFLEYAKRIDSLYKELEREFLKEKSDILDGDYRISSGGTIAAFLLPNIIKKIHKEFPTLSLRVFEGDALETRNALLQGEVELAILSEVLPEKNLIHLPFYTDSIVPVVSKNHILAKKNIIHIDDIRNQAFILFHSSSSIQRDIEKRFKRFKPRLKPFVLMELRSLESVLRSIEAGLGIGFISDSSLNTKLKVLDISSLHIERTYYIIHHRHPKSGLPLLISRLQKFTDYQKPG